MQRSTLRRKVNREEHTEVPPQFKRWVWAGGKRLKGLAKKAYYRISDVSKALNLLFYQRVKSSTISTRGGTRKSWLQLSK
ncbi:glycoside hydrolase family protein [Alloalcanivorax xenomutans]|uniref:glycoside hydrolase family protein n=1 Tax=Alloalcanivorax xenomutans TaxID=1094342 RepID=UPI003BAC8C5A